MACNIRKNPNYNPRIKPNEDCRNCGAPLDISKCKCTFCETPLNFPQGKKHGDKSFAQALQDLSNAVSMSGIVLNELKKGE